VLNSPQDKRQKNLLEDLAAFPYVNGRLFEENLGFADLNRSMRTQLLRCCNLDWSRISPAVFGSLFQSVMEPKERRQVGAHYTSERDILKLINSLFLDELKDEFEKVKHDGRKLKAFHDKLGKLRFLDPACGCGNFLVVTYRELRLLELEVLKLLLKNQQVTDVGLFSQVDVDAMCGIEINEFPSLIAEVAMWLIDHQMNLLLSEEFGQYFIRLPLKKSAKIVHANALRINWADVITPEECSYILGNPPFVGAMLMGESQREDMASVFRDLKGYGVLDYVACWYWIAATFIRSTKIEVGFVSTNSISQGEQVALLWQPLMQKHGIKINFAHQTFQWQSEARGKAAVHCVIIGFSVFEKPRPTLFVYDGIGQDAIRLQVKSINGYLVEGTQVFITNTSIPLCDAPKMRFGSMPRDDGNLILTQQEKEEAIRNEPGIAQYIRLFLGAHELLNNGIRYCIWLLNADPHVVSNSNFLMERLSRVKAFREASNAASTRKFAKTPGLFCQIAQPDGDYVLIPRHSSQSRRYIPMAFKGQENIVADSCLSVERASLYHFGVLMSTIHNAWSRTLCGRIKSDYRYSKDIVYNNFPWPQKPTDKQKANVEANAQAVLDARAKYPESSLADLYDPLTMPPELVKAHEQLDKAVEQCYRSKPFESDRERVEYLFQLYEQLTAPLTAQADKPKRTRKKKTEDAE
jgi:hypothetical protein